MALLHVNAQELEFAVDVVPDTITISQLIASPDVPVTVAQLEVNPPAIVTDDNGEYLGVFTEFYDGIPDDLASLFNLEGIPVPVPADSPETPPPADSPETIATNVRRQAEEHASVERRQAAPTCPGTTKLYTWSPDFVSYPAAMRGAWGYYIPNYPVNGPSSSRFPAASQIRFERRDTNININMLSSTDASGEVPGWRTSFSPVARTFNNWYDKIFVEWNFRLLVPCTGIYTFQMVADGMVFFCVCG